MNKKNLLITFITSLIFINSCSGYDPIFSSSNLQFRIVEYSTKGDNKLSKQIYFKLYNLSKNNENNVDAKDFDIIIKTKKIKKSTIKSNTGKILEYEINLITNITIIDSLNKNNLMQFNDNIYSSYRVQDQYSDTLALENKTVENLLSRSYQSFLIQLSDNLLKK
tara:strand:- start:69 stop:563 length:495 start_codon:yes stop_codon:yes gene_type:complete